MNSDVTAAVTTLTVNILGALIVYTVYLNFLLLKPYTTPLFWGCVLSIPLHSIKQYILLRMQCSLGKELFLVPPFVAMARESVEV